MKQESKVIDIQNWKRKEHYEFFSKMDSPYFGVTAEVDCTKAYDFAKANNLSFFSYYLHKSMQAVNLVEELKLRIIDNQVVLFDTIHAGCTIARQDETFGFSYIEFNSDYSTFNNDLQKEILEVQNTSGLRLNNDDIDKNLIRHSTFPWHSFTSLLHPTSFGGSESVPKIVFGKYKIVDGKKMLPVSIEAHHGLADGFHLAKYFRLFQDFLNSEEF